MKACFIMEVTSMTTFTKMKKTFSKMEIGS
jgi:hypothetical protein